MTPKDLTYLPLRLKERNEPTVVFLLSSQDGEGNLVPYPGLNKEFSLYVKQRPQDDDPTPILGERLPDQDTKSEAAVGVTVPSSQLATARRLFYHLDATPPRETVAWGPLVVMDL